ncbi:MAG TPA: TolC family protein [Candidatus Acidoferrum sp.]|nr:TolC family protein [Candidatus Acidoferrum sp.]
MSRTLPIAGLLACASIVLAQEPPPLALTLTLEDAMQRARANSQQLLSADITARLAHEDKVQAKAALLPSLNWENGYVYTQPNGTDTGVFVVNNGVHVYTNQLALHADVFSPGKRADYQMAIAGEAIARARLDIAQRGLMATVVQNYYAMVSAQRHMVNAQRGMEEAGRFLDITRKQEVGGEAARADVVKAQIEVNNRQRDLREAQLAIDKARIGFAVFLFLDFRQDFGVVDDLDQLAVLPAFSELEGRAQKDNPDLRAAQAFVTQNNFGIKSARAGLLPTLTLDYFYGLQANQYAIHNPAGNSLLGSSVVATATVPVWNWGAARSKIKQAELRQQQARVDLSLTQRQLQANLNEFYLEAATANTQMTLLKQTLDLAEESLRLTILRYEAGEATVLEVVDAQRTALDARNAWDDGKARYRVALSALQTLTGAF